MIPLDGLFAVGVQLDMATWLFLAIFGELYHPERLATGSMGLVCLPSKFTINIQQNVGKCTMHGSYGLE